MTIAAKCSKCGEPLAANDDRHECPAGTAYHVVANGRCVDCGELAKWNEPCPRGGNHGLGATPRPLVPEFGRKYDSGKLRYSLVDWSALAWLTASLTYGAVKYAPENWRLVEDARNRYYDALMRHMEAWRAGEDDDAESGLPHLANAMFCVMCLTGLYAPRDLKVAVVRTTEAIRRWRAIEAARSTSTPA